MNQTKADVKSQRIGLDLTEGSIVKGLVVFAIPIVLTNLIQQLYSLVDLMVIGQYAGSSGTVGVSTGGEIADLITPVATAFATAGQIYIAQLFGAREEQKVKESAGTLITMMFLISVFFMVGTILLCMPILNVLNCPPEAMEQAASYMIITAVGMPFIFGYNAVCGLLRGLGESKRPMIFIIIAAIINIFLDILLVAVFHMGAAGTAWATVIGQGLSFAFSIILLYRRRDQFGFDFKLRSFAIDRETAATILKIGIPISAQYIFIQATQLVIIRHVNLLGLVQAAAYGIADKILTFTTVVSQATNQAGSAIVAQNLGGRKFDRVRRTVYSTMAVTMSAALALSACSLLFPQQIFGLFTRDEALFSMAPVFMRAAALTYILGALVSAYDTVTVGSGFAALAFTAGFLDGVVLRLAFGFFFGEYLQMGAAGFFLGSNMARLGPILCHGLYYYSGAWKRRRMLAA